VQPPTPNRPGVPARIVSRAGLLMALVVLGAAYVGLVVQHGSLWLGDAIVHESGRYSFAGTVFYFEHFVHHYDCRLLRVEYRG
jgi:hypothetical protein